MSGNAHRVSFAALTIGTALALVTLLTLPIRLEAAEEWPELPERDAVVEIPAQEWPLRPGPRRVRVLVHYPQGRRDAIQAGTGIMLTLHNWGGTDCVGTANPRQLADQLNVVAMCVNYLQSGKVDSIDGPEPYDFGYLQALDALRALWWMFDGLKTGRTSTRTPIVFDPQRIYATGGSGGGNVTLMANKLAPRTFACVVDLCGMKKLSDDIAFHLPGGSDLNARYQRDPSHPYYLSLDHQELRFLGNPDHLQTMRELGASARILVFHGVDDVTCPFADAVEMVDWMRRRQLDVEPHFIRRQDVDGQVFASTGHSLGDRTQIVLQQAGARLRPDSPTVARRSGPTDFERRDDIRYATSEGAFIISYTNGYPIARFEPRAALPEYADHHDLLAVQTASGQKSRVTTPVEWQTRADHVRRHLQRVMGPLPSPLRRVPLDVRVVDETRVGELVRKKLTYQSDPDDRVSAYLFLPVDAGGKQRRAAVLCLQQTTGVGKDEPAGVRGDPTMKYALELAQRGFVTLAPDYPSFGEHPYDFAPAHGYASGSMKAVWDNIRAIDLLESLDEVAPDRMGCIGHSLGGHNGLFTAVFESRIKALVSSCGFSSLRKDDVPSWTGPRYMPRIASQFGNDVARVPFDFPELLGCLAPRHFLAVAATRDSDFDVSGVRDCLEAARPIYALYGAPERLAAEFPDAPHSFPDDAGRRAYEFLERALAK